MAKTCKKGEIMRKAYTRKAYTRNNGTTVKKTRVKASCIKDMGKPGKGKKLFTLKKGDLTKYGYHLKSNKETRHKSLNKAKKHISYASLIRKLNALSILHKNTNPVYASKARSDMKYLREMYK